MRIGEMEGTPEEIKDFCENNGLNVEDYLEKTEKPLSRIHFVIPSVLYVISILLLTIPDNSTSNIQITFFLIGCCCSLWLAVNVQIRFKNIWATSFVIIGGIAFMLVALGAISPRELLEQAKSLKPE